MGGAIYTKDVTKRELGLVKFHDFHFIDIKSLHKGGKITIVDTSPNNHGIKKPVVRKVKSSSLESKRISQDELPMYRCYGTDGNSSQNQEPAAVAFVASPIAQLINQVSGNQAAEIWNNYERVRYNVDQILKQSRKKQREKNGF